MIKNIDTGIETCDLCDKIAVEVLSTGSRCVAHSGDPKNHSLLYSLDVLRRVLGAVLTHGRAKEGKEEEYLTAVNEATTQLWKV